MLPLLLTEDEMDLLADLNRAQRAAVTHNEGPLLIVAGVGTGKTTAITRRIAWLIAEKKARPSEILALTFTERAAAEMEARVDVLVPYGYIEALIATFHSFCDRILREQGLLLGLSPDFRVLTEAEQAIFLKERLFDLPLARFRPLGNPMRHLRALLSLFSRAKDEDVSPEAYAAYVQSLQNGLSPIGEDPMTAALAEEAAQQHELAEVYAAYQRLLAKSGFVDFGDQIALTLRLFREHPDVLRQYQERFQYILVDEFQDTNSAQFELLRMLAAHRNLTVCGDDDQSIYRFRGAAISNILGFQECFPDATLVVLDDNYRSTQAILDAAYRLIQHNNPDRLEVRAGISKRLRSHVGPGTMPRLHFFESLEEECEFVAETIAARHREEARAYAQFAVLVRSNAQADPFLRAMNLLRLPWRFSGSRGLYDQEEIRFAMAFLRVMADPHDSLSLHALAASAPYEVPAESLAAAAGLARRRNHSLLQVLRRHADHPEVLSETSDAAEAIRRLLEDLDAMFPLSTRERTGELLYQYLHQQTGLISRLTASGSPQDVRRVQNLARFFSIVERFARVARYDRAAWFVDYLDNLIDAGDNPPEGDAGWDADAVNLLTIHQAKGLEFPIVFLVGLVSGRFPSAHRADPIPLPDALIKDRLSTADGHQQEERRLFYVGMTRAKDDLYLLCARDYGGKRPRKPSLFVSEALDVSPAQIPVERRATPRLVRPTPSLKAEDAGTTDPVLVHPGEPILSLSHRRIDDYLTCPKKYHYIHHMRIPIRQHHAVIYGHAVHQAIRVFHLNQISQRDTPLRVLHDAFRKAWHAEGFLTRQHEELRLQQGLQALRAFHAAETASPSIPSYVEKRFSVLVGDVRLIGVFDRIDQVDGDGVIIDYKTSEVTSEEQAIQQVRASRQMALYAIAYELLFSRPPAALELRFLTPELIVGRTEPTSKMMEQVRDDLHRASVGIRQGEFPATPVYLACSYCPYAFLCPDRKVG